MHTYSVSAQSALNKAHELRRFDAIGLTRTLHGYYYISHYPPLRAQDEVTAQEAQALLARVDASHGFETYIHFPFCEVLCSFCHFMKELGGQALGQKEELLLDAVEKEIRMYTRQLGRIDVHSLQLGGGTPSLMSNSGLRRILDFVDRQFRFDANAERKIELFPKRSDKQELREKLAILKGHGFTDIVIDIESGNQQSLGRIGRKITSLDAYVELVGECVDAGFDSIVSALMMGLPHETMESLEATVRTLISMPEVRVINTFPAIMREPDALIAQYQKHPEWFPNAEERDAMWILARDLFRQNGYGEGPISYLHGKAKRPQQQSDKFECVNLISFGPSAFAYWNGDGWAAQCFNYANLPDYYRRIGNDELPLWRAGVMDNNDRARRKLIFGLANCKTEDLEAIERRFGVSIDQLFGRELNALFDKGLVRIDKAGHGVFYTEDGLSRLEEISYFFGSDAINQRTKSAVSATHPHRVELRKQHYYPVITTEDERRFKTFVRDYPQEFMHRLA